jgi:hypothetical protein
MELYLLLLLAPFVIYATFFSSARKDKLAKLKALERELEQHIDLDRNDDDDELDYSDEKAGGCCGGNEKGGCGDRGRKREWKVLEEIAGEDREFGKGLAVGGREAESEEEKKGERIPGGKGCCGKGCHGGRC